MKPLHVALVIDTLRGGGAERSTVSLARGLTHRGHSVDLVTFSDEVARYERELPSQVRLFKVNLRRKNLYWRRIEQIQVVWRYRRKLNQLMKSRTHGAAHPYIGWKWLLILRGRGLEDSRALVEYINQAKPDCVLPALSRAKISTLLARSFAEWKPAVIPIVRGVTMIRMKKTRDRYRLLFPLADQIVAVSMGVRENVAQDLDIPAARITSIYNPIEIGRIESLAEELPNHPWMTDGGSPNIISAGRLTVSKDFQTLLKALAEVRKKYSARLIILGEGSCRENLETMVSKLRLSECVSLPGWVENPFSFMRRASAFVLSSRWEGLANVLIEALASGCPVVSTDCPGSAEILNDGRVGPMVPVGDHIALADAICNVLANPPDVEMLKAQARKFSFERSIDDYERLILVAGRNRFEAGTRT